MSGHSTMVVVSDRAMDVGALVRRARRESGLTQHALAELAGVQRQTVTGIESGRRRPSLETLVGLLAAAGLQMRVELEPLDSDVRRLIEERRALAEPSADVVGAWRLFTTLLEMDAVAYRVEGLAAAALIGAPVAVPTIQVALAATDATYEWLARHLFLSAFRVRVDGRWGALDFDFPTRWTADGPGEGAAVRVRDRLAEECPDGRFRLEGFEEVAARLAPAGEVARHVQVVTSAGPVAVQPLDEIESADPDVARVLRVMRSR